MAFDIAKCMIRTPEQTQADIESVNRCLNPLSLYTTADLVAELNRRGGCPVNCPTIDETSTAPVCLPVIPTAPLVNELCSREGVESHSISESYQVSIVHEIECLDPVEVYGPAKIIVVRGE